VRKQTWPDTGIKYSYQDRYIKTEKLALWLERAFGKGKGKYIHYNDYFYITAPRKPTRAELQWLMDPGRSGGVQVAECGFLSLA